MGKRNGLFKEDIFNKENLEGCICILEKLVSNYPAIHKLNYKYSKEKLTEKQITGSNKSIEVDLMVAWGILIKVRNKDAYKLNPNRIRTLSAAILILQN